MPETHDLGSAPIEPKYADMMREVALVLDRIFNVGLRGLSRKTGFVLLVFPFGDAKDGRCNYISNGADRQDIIKLLREQANRFDTQTQ